MSVRLPRPTGVLLAGVLFSPGLSLVCKPETAACSSCLWLLQMRSMNSRSKMQSAGFSDKRLAGASCCTGIVLGTMGLGASFAMSFLSPSLLPSSRLSSSLSSVARGLSRVTAAFLSLMPFDFVGASAGAGGDTASCAWPVCCIEACVVMEGMPCCCIIGTICMCGICCICPGWHICGICGECCICIICCGCICCCCCSGGCCCICGNCCCCCCCCDDVCCCADGPVDACVCGSSGEEGPVGRTGAGLAR
mmetsp:Transcript_55342/g.140660  ORF Transcript_55342/g.140660 Transcript_55342/m.140660 type:complete len:250 (-) Transcript_55342:263-1012(-)